ncbi:DUF7344 domain-containing protein [Halorussus lipolyticus]|uniref:DUF7344 domain-containing protein n=1 Tax=Halorussus lipolyticus TaxID=3034024 RepID=UPI0023E8A959|nr:hypothetical protein [Halorussus sp. DT80]
MGNERQNLVGDALNHPRRRAVIRRLVTKYLPIPVPSFATYLALSQFPDAETDDFEAFRAEVYDELVRTHLPKLHEAGIVDYDPEVGDGVIDEGPEFERAVALVERPA